MKRLTPAARHRLAAHHLRRSGLVWLRLAVGAILLLTSQVALAQSALWRTYLDAGIRSFEQGEELEGEAEKNSYAEARKRFELARQEADALGPQDPRLATVVLWLAATYLKEGKVNDAELVTKQLGPGGVPGAAPIVEMARPLLKIGDSYYGMKKFATAEPFYRMGVASLQGSPPAPHHKLLPHLLYGLGSVVYFQDRNPEAVELLQKALQLIDINDSEYDLLLGRIYQRLGHVKQTQTDYAEAERYYRLALETYYNKLKVQAYFGALENLSDMFESRGEYAQQETTLKGAIALLESAKDPFGTLANYTLNLGFAYQGQEKYADALSTYQKVKAIWDQKLKADDARHNTILNNIAKMYYFLGRYSEAEPIYQQVIAAARKANDTDGTVWFEKNYALLLYARGNREQAEPLFKQSVAKLKDAQLATSWFELGELFRKQERFAEAEPLLKQALEARQKFLQADHLDLALTMERYAMTLRMLKRQPEALKLEEQAMAIRSKHTAKK